MTRSRWSAARPDPSSQETGEGFPELQQTGDELDVRRTLNGLQELMVLSMLMFDRHHVEGVMRVFASSVRAVTGCELVEVRRRRGNTWISWPGPGLAVPEPEPVPTQSSSRTVRTGGALPRSRHSPEHPAAWCSGARPGLTPRSSSSSNVSATSSVLP